MFILITNKEVDKFLLVSVSDETELVKEEMPSWCVYITEKNHKLYSRILDETYDTIDCLDSCEARWGISHP